MVRTERRKSRRAAVLTAAAILVAASAGATGVPSYTDVLAHPHRLEAVPGEEGARRWLEPGVDFGRYDKILLERIQVRIADDAQYRAVDPTDLKTLVDYFHGAIVRALGDAYPIVERPDRGVLRVRTVIYDLVPTKPEISVAALVVPYATVLDLASGEVSGRPLGSAPYLGRTGIAVQLLDGESGRIVGEYADDRPGRKYDIDTRDGVTGAVTEGVSDYLRSYSTWAYAQQAFDHWAALFRQRLDVVHGR